MPNGYTSLSSDSVVLRYGERAEIFLSNAWVGINHVEGKVDLQGDNANFKIGEENRFFSRAKDAHIDCSTGSVYCNGEMLCCVSLLRDLGKLFKADPKPASVMIS